MMLIHKRSYLLICLTILLVPFANATSPATNLQDDIPVVAPLASATQYTSWVDSVFQSLSLEERIAQLLMIRVHTDKDEAYYRQIQQLVSTYNLGGIAFFRGGPQRQVQVTNRLQHAAKTPLLVAMDAEWGPSMRLDSTIVFPRQMTLGAIKNDTLIYQMGLEIGRQLQRLGVHINFAPVVDVNNNPDNPVINFRSFGEDRQQVARKSLAYMNGLQDAGIIACAKHFPGHGDTNADSHHTLPLIKHSVAEIDSIHLYPFRELIDNGLHAVMVAHLEIPSLEPEKKLASTLSTAIVTDLLQTQLGFSGLVITDALDMRGVSDYFKSGELELKALKAGNDILLLPENIPAAIQAIKKAIANNELDEEIVNSTCRKILGYKQFAGLDNFQHISAESLIADLNTGDANRLNRELARAAITLVKNEKNILPLTSLDDKKIASLSIGRQAENDFTAMLSLYVPVTTFSMAKDADNNQQNDIVERLDDFDVVIISVHNNSMFPARRYGISQQTVNLIQSISRKKQVILCLFANPYSLAYFDNFSKDIEAILVGYEDGVHFEEATAQAIFGGIPVHGQLPVRGSRHFPAGTGFDNDTTIRIQFGDPQDVGILPEYLNQVDSIVLEGINHGAYPGCQLVIMKDGIVFYHKAFGRHTYANSREVSTTDLYDLASLTKILATTAAMMKLSDQDKVSVDKTLGHYLDWLKGTDKGDIRIRDLMAHQARLQAWIPFYVETLVNMNLSPGLYSNHPSDEFSIEVARNLYLKSSYRDSIMAQIVKSPLLNRRNYIYSDLGFILLADLVKEQSGLALDQYIDNMFIKPMGLQTLGYSPLSRFDAGRIIPTEYDTLFRKQVIHGYVHDPGAAMLGGVSGHAGLFGNALDVAIMMQMFLEKGTYGGVEYIDEATLREFTRVQFPGQKNRRGLGFDKPTLDRSPNGPVTISASPNSFGHSGFTGTYAWADPKENLVFVFLSNRVYPYANNNRISRMNIRTNIHQTIYEAIYKSRQIQYSFR